MRQRPTESTKITLSDGIERTLRYPLSALKEAKQEFGASIMSFEALKNLNEDNIGKLVWYGLRADDPSITVEQIDALIEMPMLPYIMQQFALALGGSLPEPSKNAQASATETESKTSIGSDSGQSDATTLAFQTANSGA
jgi:hypothetical protein